MKTKRWKLVPLQKCTFHRCSWNRQDVILFSVVWKITASRENHTELLGDEVMKTALHCNCTLQVTLIEFKQLLYRTGIGSLFLHCKATWLISVRIINQSILCSTIKECITYEDFVSRNLLTVACCNSPNYNCKAFHKFLWHILRSSKSSIMNWGNHRYIIRDTKFKVCAEVIHFQYIAQAVAFAAIRTTKTRERFAESSYTTQLRVQTM